MLAYALVSTLISEDRSATRQGMRLLAEVAHKYEIPMTWAIDAMAARAFANDLTGWHESHADEVLLMLDIEPLWQTEADLNDPRQSAEHTVTMREKIPQHIMGEWEKVQRALPWARPIVAGARFKNAVLLHALNQVGFKGVWGYRPEQIREDEGCPFGVFYPSADRHHFCGSPSSRVVAMPYAADDMLLADFLASQGKLADYLDSLAYNPWLAYTQHIEATQVREATPEQIGQLDAYFASIREGDNANPQTLVDAVLGHRQTTEQTLPTCLLTTRAGVKLAYYDLDCQLYFDEGDLTPTRVINYVSPPINSRSGAEFNLPQLEQFRPSRSRSRLQMAFTIESTKAMPYGLAIWGNHAGLLLDKTNAQAVKWLGERLLFVRVDLEPGRNTVEVTLTI